MFYAIVMVIIPKKEASESSVNLTPQLSRTNSNYQCAPVIQLIQKFIHVIVMANILNLKESEIVIL